MELVNIPIFYGEERAPLANISSKVGSYRNMILGKGCRKWKRVVGNKGESSGKGTSSKIETATGGDKRVWSLRDEADDKNLSLEEIAKRPRGVINDLSITMEVGVASLNWLQPHQ